MADDQSAELSRALNSRLCLDRWSHLADGASAASRLPGLIRDFDNALSELTKMNLFPVSFVEQSIETERTVINLQLKTIAAEDVPLFDGLKITAFVLPESHGNHHWHSPWLQFEHGDKDAAFYFKANIGGTLRTKNFHLWETEEGIKSEHKGEGFDRPLMRLRCYARNRLKHGS